MSRIWSSHKKSKKTKTLIYIVLIISVLILFSKFMAKADFEKAIELPKVTDMPKPQISPLVPEDVEIPEGFEGLPITFFDDFSWRTFIALVWPSQMGSRGKADTTKQLGDKTVPVVFETYKSDWEVFQPGGVAPSAWNSFEAVTPCGELNTDSHGITLASFSKFHNVGLAGQGELVSALVAQNRTYLRFLTGFNEIEYEQILKDKLYIKANQNNIKFSNGAIDIKSAWMEMKDIANHDRYYTRMATVLDLETGTCKKVLVGLVGLHIVVKTPSRPQWIWSSFEQIDNISQPDAQQPFALNNSDGTPMDKNKRVMYPPPANPPAPLNVDRIKPIHASTKITNTAYQKALRENGNSVWQFYQLVMTQWPIPKNKPDISGTPNNTFPGNNPNDKTAFANVTMETYDQDRITTGCMACHNITKKDTDFLWALKLQGFTGSEPSDRFFNVDINKKAKSASTDPAIKSLIALMKEAAQPSATEPKLPQKKSINR